MPINIDRFEGAGRLEGPTTAQQVVRFLLEHDDQAYTRREIADAISADPETVGTSLTRLKERGLVRHREPYWAFADDREAALATLRDRYGDAFLDEIATTDMQDPDDAPEKGRHREAAMAFSGRVREHLDEVIDALYLFGSVADGTVTADSDVDVLAVVSEDADYAAVDDRLLDIAYDVQLDYGVRVEVHAIRAEEFAKRKERRDPFVRTVIEEGEVGV